MVGPISWLVGGGEGGSEEHSALAQAFRRQIERALGEKRWHFADLLCDKLLHEEPGNLPAWLLKGDLAWHCFRDHGAAIAHYRRVLSLGASESSNECVERARASLEQLLAHLS